MESVFFSSLQTARIRTAMLTLAWNPEKDPETREGPRRISSNKLLICP